MITKVEPEITTIGCAVSVMIDDAVAVVGDRRLQAD